LTRRKQRVDELERDAEALLSLFGRNTSKTKEAALQKQPAGCCSLYRDRTNRKSG
jgi:hypothetical protein